jgi:outer membrane protein
VTRVWIIGALALSTAAFASEPLTYAEVMRGSIDANPSLQRALLAADQSESDLGGATGQYDPNLELGSTWSRSVDRGFFQGFPFDSASTNTDFRTSVSGQVPTGTSYRVDGGLNRSLSDFTSNFGGFESRQITDTYRGNLGVSVTQQLLKGVRLKFNLQNVTRARQTWETAKLTAERTRQDTLAQAAASYWTWVYQVRLEEIARMSVAAAEEGLRVGELKVAAGELAPVEGTRLQAALVQAQSAALDADIGERTARDALLLQLGREPGESIHPATDAGSVPELDIDEAKAVEVALSQNLEVAVSRRTLELAEIEAKNARHGVLPSLAATASLGTGSQVGRALDENGDVIDNESQSFPQGGAGDALSNLFSDPLPTYSLGGTFTVPLGNRAARSTRESTELGVQQRQSELLELERSIASQVQQQVRQLESARRKVELADANQRLAEQTLGAEEALAEAGRSIQKDVLEARTEVDRTRAEAAKARTDYRQAQVEMLRLQGQLTERVP